VQRGACGRSNCRRLGKLTMTSSSSGAVGRRRSCGDRRDGRVRAASTMPAPGLQGMSVMWQGGHVRGASAVSAPVPVWRVRGGRRGSRQLLLWRCRRDGGSATWSSRRTAVIMSGREMKLAGKGPTATCA
jgi:hypothetical protein